MCVCVYILAYKHQQVNKQSWMHIILYDWQNITASQAQLTYRNYHLQVSRVPDMVPAAAVAASSSIAFLSLCLSPTHTCRLSNPRALITHRYIYIYTRTHAHRGVIASHQQRPRISLGKWSSTQTHGLLLHGDVEEEEHNIMVLSRDRCCLLCPSVSYNLVVARMYIALSRARGPAAAAASFVPSFVHFIPLALSFSLARSRSLPSSLFYTLSRQ